MPQKPRSRVWTAARRGAASHAARLSRSFALNDRGVTAIEFAILAMPFLMMILATAEVMLVFFAAIYFEDAVRDSARMIRTGEVQQLNLDAAGFRQLICDRVDVFIDCDDSLQVDVRNFEDFGAITFPEPVNADGELDDSFTFDAGNGGDIVLVRAFYVRNVLPIPYIGLGNMTDSTRLIQASAAFRNEPF